MKRVLNCILAAKSEFVKTDEPGPQSRQVLGGQRTLA